MKICEDSSFETYLNQYNVIHLDITLFISRTSHIRDIVKNINDAVMGEIAQAFTGIPIGTDLAETLVCVAKATGERFIMIIDEWDALFREAKEDVKVQKEYISFLRSLFKSNWTDTIFDLVYMTGILLIKKYGTQSETYESLKLYIEMNEDGLKESIVQMLGGAHVKIDVATFQNDMTNIKSKDDVLTLLVHLGYLAYDIEAKSVYIPNEEVREEFVRAVTKGKHTEIAKLIRNSDALLEATLNMDEETVAVAKNKVHSCKIEEYFI